LNFKEILELIDKVAESGIGAVEVEQAGTKVRIEGKKSEPQHVFVTSGEKSDAPVVVSSALAASPSSSEEKKAEEKKDASKLSGHIITAPLVGTFYRTPNPEAGPFVNVGDRVTKGQVLCIIEAMKLMNEIESDVDGVITEIYPQNGQPVEYGEPLFSVRV
jgi:acetyl-CoA carboxylase biotin carboxyl carrier protein